MTEREHDRNFLKLARIAECDIPRPIPKEWISTRDQIEIAKQKAMHAVHMLDLAADVIDQQDQESQKLKAHIEGLRKMVQRAEANAAHWRRLAIAGLFMAAAFLTAAIWLAKEVVVR